MRTNFLDSIDARLTVRAELRLRLISLVLAAAVAAVTSLTTVCFTELR